MSVTRFDALASASAPVGSRCWIGRSCFMYSSCSRVTLPSLSLACLAAQLVDACLLSLHFPEGTLNALDVFVNGIFNTGHVDIVDTFGSEGAGARLEIPVARRGSEPGASRGLPEFQ
eukprot:7359843-Pyramimonas_sp.AAC.1